MKKILITSLGALATAMAFGQFFPENSLVVSRVNGTTAVAASVDLIGFNYDGSSNGKVFGLGTGFTLTGNSTSEGQMNASVNYLALGGYSDPAGTAGVATLSTTRRVAVFNNAGAGSVNYIDMQANIYAGSNIRSAYTTNGTTVLTAGTASSSANAGWRTTTSGTSTQLGTTTNTRVIKQIGATIYGGTGSGTTASGNPRGIYSLSGGTQTPILDTGDASSAYDFEFYSENANNYILVADDRATASGGGLQVWKAGSLIKTIVLPGTTSALRSIGIRDWWNGAVRETSIFGISGGNTIVGITFDYGHLEDAGTSAFTSLQTAGAGTVYRSIEIVPEPASFAIMGLGLLGLAARRRRKS